MNPLRALSISISRMPPAVMLTGIVGIAVGVTFFVTDKLHSVEVDANNKTAALTAQMSAKQTVVYCIKDIPEGMTIPSEALEERQIEQSKVPVDALSSNTLVAGRIAKYGIMTNTIVSSHDLAPQGISVGFESRLKEGMRAVTFAVDNNSGVAGFVSPESHVDIIGTVGTGPDTKARPVLSDVEVIAVGQSYQKTPGSTVAVPASSVTVAVSPDDTQKLIKAILASKIYLSLRNDKDRTPVATVDVTSLFAKPMSSTPSQLSMMTQPPLPPMPVMPSDSTNVGESSAVSTPPPKPLHEIEAWAGSKKDVISVPHM